MTRNPSPEVTKPHVHRAALHQAWGRSRHATSRHTHTHQKLLLGVVGVRAPSAPQRVRMFYQSGCSPAVRNNLLLTETRGPCSVVRRSQGNMPRGGCVCHVPGALGEY